MTHENDDNIIYTLSEVYGPLECEHIIDEDGNTCNQEAWAVIIDRNQFEKLPSDEIKRPIYILENGIGKVACSNHGGC